jgi:hypothetical protein
MAGTSTLVFRTAEDGQDFFDFVSGRREPPEWMGQSRRLQLRTCCGADATTRLIQVWRFKRLFERGRLVCEV